MKKIVGWGGGGGEGGSARGHPHATPTMGNRGMGTQKKLDLVKSWKLTCLLLKKKFYETFLFSLLMAPSKAYLGRGFSVWLIWSKLAWLNYSHLKILEIKHFFYTSLFYHIFCVWCLATIWFDYQAFNSNHLVFHGTLFFTMQNKQFCCWFLSITPWIYKNLKVLHFVKKKKKKSFCASFSCNYMYRSGCSALHGVNLN